MAGSTADVVDIEFVAIAGIDTAGRRCEVWTIVTGSKHVLEVALHRLAGRRAYPREDQDNGGQ